MRSCASETVRAVVLHPPAQHPRPPAGRTHAPRRTQPPRQSQRTREPSRTPRKNPAHTPQNERPGRSSCLRGTQRACSCTVSSGTAERTGTAQRTRRTQCPRPAERTREGRVPRRLRRLAHDTAVGRLHHPPRAQARARARCRPVEHHGYRCRRSHSQAGTCLRRPRVVAIALSRVPLRGLHWRSRPLRGTSASMSRLRKVIAERAGRLDAVDRPAHDGCRSRCDPRIAALRTSVKDTFLTATGLKLSFPAVLRQGHDGGAARLPDHAMPRVEDDTIVYPESEKPLHCRGKKTPERGWVLKYFFSPGHTVDAGDLCPDRRSSLGRSPTSQKRTRENKLKPDELAGGTFTLTNTGSRAARCSTLPSCSCPPGRDPRHGCRHQEARGRHGGRSGRRLPCARLSTSRSLPTTTGSSDGADAARFLTAVKERLEEADFDDDLGI